MESWIQKHATPEEIEQIEQWRSRRHRHTPNPAKRAAKRQQKLALEIERGESCERAEIHLERFWREFTAADTKEKRLVALRRAANPGYPKVTKDLRRSIRSRFIGRWRKASGKCRVCESEKAVHRHHIIPACYGGHNGDTNLLEVGTRCHAAIHPWMAR